MTRWPQPIDDAALHGPAGEFVLRTEPHSEAHPVALLSQFLVGFGTACGRGAHYQVEADRHYPNEFCVLVGPSAPAKQAPTVEEVLRFEDLPVGSSATRAVFVRWSDGTESQALAWYGDEVLSPVAHVGRQ
jgi:hypothetical protein